MRALVRFRETPNKSAFYGNSAQLCVKAVWRIKALTSFFQPQKFAVLFNQRLLAYKLFTATALFAVCFSAGAEQLKEYLWTNRVIVTFASEKSAPERLSLIKQIAEHPCEFRKRDLVHIDLIAGSNDYQALSQKFSITDKEFRLVLVGKDGKVKLNANNPSIKELFVFIDGMPLRKREVSTERC
jgi:hypothetical protein